MTILERLKTETRPQHDRIEQVSFGDRIMNGTLTPEEYKILIINNFKIHDYIERTLETMPEITNIPGLDFEKRKKTQLLEKDLELLGLNPADHRSDNIDLPLTSKSEALGAYYVIEGSTLGGSVISRALAKNAQVSAIGAFNFYGCYGEMVGPMWKQFCQVLMQEGGETEKQDVMVASASRTFDALTNLFTAVHSNQI